MKERENGIKINKRIVSWLHISIFVSNFVTIFFISVSCCWLRQLSGRLEVFRLFFGEFWSVKFIQTRVFFPIFLFQFLETVQWLSRLMGFLWVCALLKQNIETKSAIGLYNSFNLKLLGPSNDQNSPPEKLLNGNKAHWRQRLNS